jgi:hypothetical protein
MIGVAGAVAYCGDPDAVGMKVHHPLKVESLAATLLPVAHAFGPFLTASNL